MIPFVANRQSTHNAHSFKLIVAFTGQPDGTIIIFGAFHFFENPQIKICVGKASSFVDNALT